jgi:hypothetical protein
MHKLFFHDTVDLIISSVPVQKTRTALKLCLLFVVATKFNVS